MTSSSPFAVLWNSDQPAGTRTGELANGAAAAGAAAHVALACAQGTANAVTARTLRLHLDTVRRWRKRFTAEGLAAPEVAAGRSVDRHAADVRA
ncbi:helix-turn-helix domain-containing protein [Streptomyces sp. NPDC087859]|uniref:helix-turn-helix domain-containing protein n=1 Tax=Streptomyces sp. NPDC087859 TaxID=3365812 RepID=UPI003829F8E0